MLNIFLSYSAADREFVSKLALNLKEFGYQPWLDEWEIGVGDCIISKIEKGIAGAHFIIIVLTETAVSSGWVEREWKVKYWQEITRDRPMVLPVLLKDCQVPLLLQTRKYADFRSSFDKGFLELLLALKEYMRHESELFSDAARLGVHRLGQGEDSKDFESILTQANDDLTFVYLSGGDQIRRNFDLLSNWCKARAHRRVRFLGLNPENESLVRAAAATTAKRSWRLYREMMRDTINRALELRRETLIESMPRVEVRVHNAAPFATITIADRQAATSGRMYVELYAFGQSWKQRPFFVLDRGQLFETYVKSCEKLWEIANDATLGKL